MKIAVVERAFQGRAPSCSFLADQPLEQPLIGFEHGLQGMVGANMVLVAGAHVGCDDRSSWWRSGQRQKARSLIPKISAASTWLNILERTRSNTLSNISIRNSSSHCPRPIYLSPKSTTHKPDRLCAAYSGHIIR